jgi:hypothetical protein
MKRSFSPFILFCSVLLMLHSCSAQPKQQISKIEMHLSAFGVEADDFPSIDVIIDLASDSSRCVKSYYNPAYKGSVYHLSKEELEKIRKLLENTALSAVQKEYTTNKSDQPRSTTIIYSSEGKFEFNDYGLLGNTPLKELYNIIYKFRP